MITDPGLRMLESRRSVFDRLRKKKPPPLSGVPAARREKSYCAGSGYVYQYVYTGQRTAAYHGESGTEYVFDVTADRRVFFAVPVFVSDAALEPWQAAQGRELSTTERYAVAKMALFQAFDERRKPAEMRAIVRVRPADAKAILETLGIAE